LKSADFENSISHMYLDTAGKVTVGVGNMLPNADAAKQLAFEMRPDSTAKPPIAIARAATGDEIAADFESVKKRPAGLTADKYKESTKTDLPDAAIDELLNARVKDFLVQLTASFPDFPTYPEEVCAGLFDMAFNLGTSKLTTAFPTFCKAVKAQDWATAANECERSKPVAKVRNDWTKAQFDKAAADKAAAEEKAKAATTK